MKPVYFAMKSLGLSLTLCLYAGVGVCASLGFEPGQSMVELPVDTKQVVPVDVDKDGCDDLVSLRWRARGVYTEAMAPVLEVRRNTCTTVAGSLPQFTDVTPTSGTLVTMTAEQIAALRTINKVPVNGPFWINQTSGASLQVSDVDADGYADLVVTLPQLSSVFIYWNQGAHPLSDGSQFSGYAGVLDTVGGKPVGDDTHLSVLDLRYMSVAGVPVYSAIADVNGDGIKDVVSYCATRDLLGSTSQAEGFAVLLGKKATDTTHHLAFETVQVGGPVPVPATGYAIGKNAGRDNFAVGFKFFDYLTLHNGVGGDLLQDAGVEVSPRGSSAEYGPYAHQMETPFLVQRAPVPAWDKRDVVWFTGPNRVVGLTYDGTMRLMRRSGDEQTLASRPMSSAQRGDTAVLAPLAGGKQALILGAGHRVHYGVVVANNGDDNTDTAAQWLAPYQMGAWSSVVEFSGGPALLTLSGYRQPAEDESFTYNQPKSFDYDGYYAGRHWGYPASLLIGALEPKGPADASGIVHFDHLFKDADRSRTQILPVMSSMWHKPLIGAGRFKAGGDRMLYVVQDNVDTASLKVYPARTGTSAPAPLLAIDGLMPLLNNATGSLTHTLPIGQAALIQGHYATGIDPLSDPIRYVEVWLGSRLVRTLSVGPTTKDASGKGFQVSVPELSMLGTATFTLKVFNSANSAELSIRVVTPFGVLATDQDHRANAQCGLVPGTDTAHPHVYPELFTVHVDGLADGTLQGIVLVRMSDKKTHEIAAGAGGATLSGGVIRFAMPSTLEPGNWQIYVKADDQWQLVPNHWTLTDDPTVCQQQAQAVTQWPNGQCDNTSFYLDPAKGLNPQYGTMPVNTGIVYFYGHGFDKSDVQSVAFEQAGKRVWDVARSGTAGARYDNEIEVDFGTRLKAAFVPDKPISVEFYPASQAEVEAKGIAPVGKIPNWRMAKAGVCPKEKMTPLSMNDLGALTLTPGQSISVTGKGLMFPGVQNVALHLLGSDGTEYLIPGSVLFKYPTINAEENYYNTRFDNDHATLRFSLPAAMSDYKVTRSATPIAGFVPTGEFKQVINDLNTLVRPAAAAAGTGLVTYAAEFVVVAAIPITAAGYVGYKLGQNWPAIKAFFSPTPVDPPVPYEDDPRYKRLYLTFYVKSYSVPNIIDPTLYAVAVCATNLTELDTVDTKAIAIRNRLHEDEIAMVNEVHAYRDARVKALIITSTFVKDGCYPDKRQGTGIVYPYMDYNVVLRDQAPATPTTYSPLVIEGALTAYDHESIRWRFFKANPYSYRIIDSIQQKYAGLHTSPIHTTSVEDNMTWVTRDTLVP